MKRHRRPVARRGQSLVETSLGLLVFITILLFGIHFGEVMFLSMKVTEASAAPLWDATAGQVHALPGQFIPQAQSALAAANGSASGRYANFDGRTGSGGGTSTTQALSGAGNMQIQCRLGDLPFIGQGWSGAFARTVYQDNRGASCTASGRVWSIRIPIQFASGTNGFFQEDHARAAAALTVCSLGRPPCSGTMAMLIDDWGMSRAIESGECILDTSGSGAGCSGNAAFSVPVNTVWNASGFRSTEFVTLVRDVVRDVPPDLPTADNFYMSFRGEESKFLEQTDEGDNGDKLWDTTPNRDPGEYQQSHGMRKDCYLGRDC